MKAKLEFNLPDERFEYDCAYTGHKWRRVVCELENLLRNKIKYSDLTADEVVAYTTLQKHLFEQVREEGLDLDE